MNPWQIRVFGIPEPQQRPRWGAGGHVYSPKSEWAETVYRTAFAVRPPQPLTGPISCSVEFVFPRSSRAHKGDTWKTSRPDRDNLDKLILDALTRADWWIDDAQVCDGTIRKRWTAHGSNEEPGAIITIVKLDSEV